jgi:hypothetical protein
MRKYNKALDLLGVAILEQRKGNAVNAAVALAAAAKHPSAEHALAMIDKTNEAAVKAAAEETPPTKVTHAGEPDVDEAHKHAPEHSMAAKLQATDAKTTAVLQAALEDLAKEHDKPAEPAEHKEEPHQGLEKHEEIDEEFLHALAKAIAHALAEIHGK